LYKMWSLSGSKNSSNKMMVLKAFCHP